MVRCRCLQSIPCDSTTGGRGHRAGYWRRPLSARPAPAPNRLGGGIRVSRPDRSPAVIGPGDARPARGSQGSGALCPPTQRPRAAAVPKDLDIDAFDHSGGAAACSRVRSPPWPPPHYRRGACHSGNPGRRNEQRGGDQGAEGELADRQFHISMPSHSQHGHRCASSRTPGPALQVAPCACRCRERRGTCAAGR